jgi:hypothetical protein
MKQVKKNIESKINTALEKFIKENNIEGVALPQDDKTFAIKIKATTMPWYKKIATFFGFGGDNNNVEVETVESLLEGNNNSIQITQNIYNEYKDVYENKYNFTIEPGCCNDNYFISKIQNNIHNNLGRMIRG